MIAKVIDKVGKEGVITVEESQTFGLAEEVVEGMKFDKGYISPYMITSAESMEAELKDPHISHYRQKNLIDSGNSSDSRKNRANRQKRNGHHRRRRRRRSPDNASRE